MAKVISLVLTVESARKAASERPRSDARPSRQAPAQNAAESILSAPDAVLAAPATSPSAPAAAPTTVHGSTYNPNVEGSVFFPWPLQYAVMYCEQMSKGNVTQKVPLVANDLRYAPRFCTTYFMTGVVAVLCVLHDMPAIVVDSKGVWFPSVVQAKEEQEAKCVTAGFPVVTPTEVCSECWFDPCKCNNFPIRPLGPLGRGWLM